MKEKKTTILSFFFSSPRTLKGELSFSGTSYSYKQVRLLCIEIERGCFCKSQPRFEGGAAGLG